MDKTKKIKVLIIGATLIGDNEATGATMQNIMLACKDVDWMQCCLDYDPSYHVERVPTVYLDKVRSAAFFLLKSLYRKYTLSNNNAGGGSVANNPGSSVFSECCRALLDNLPQHISKRAYQQIVQFSPDLIYTMAGSIAALRLSLWLSKKLDKPIVLHLMDNLEDTFYTYTHWTTPARARYLYMLKRAYARSVYNIAIGEKMAEEYARRHHVKFSHAMNCIESLYPQPQPKNEKLRFVFSGGLHGGRGESLIELAKLIATDELLSRRMQLVVYTSPSFVEQYKKRYSGLVELHEYVPRNKMYTNLGMADVLVHVESFEQHEIDYFRYSMSTKIPECMSVGRPILCYGPRDICTVSYIDKRKVGLVADDQTSVVEAMRTLVMNTELRKELGENALRVAESEHLAVAVAARVEDVFAKSIDLWRNEQC